MRPAAPPQCLAVRAAAAPAPGAPGAADWAARSALYAAIAADFTASGFDGVTAAGGTQGLTVDALFAWDAATGLPQPRLTRLPLPVRAVVLPLAAGSAAAGALASAASEALLALCGPAGVWLQDPTAYHMSLFHASHHRAPVPATKPELAAEAAAVSAVLNASCPLRVVLERVAVTRGGVVIACWNLVAGAQPAALRAALRAALPRAPAEQLVRDAPMLHATLGRILRPPRARVGGGAMPPAEARAALALTARRLSAALCGLVATLDAGWFVLEHDALALALQGAYTPQRMPLGCEEGAAAAAGQRAGAAARGGRALDTQR